MYFKKSWLFVEKKCAEFNSLGKLIQGSDINCGDALVTCPKAYRSTEMYKCKLLFLSVIKTNIVIYVNKNIMYQTRSIYQVPPRINLSLFKYDKQKILDYWIFRVLELFLSLKPSIVWYRVMLIHNIFIFYFFAICFFQYHIQKVDVLCLHLQDRHHKEDKQFWFTYILPNYHYNMVIYDRIPHFCYTFVLFKKCIYFSRWNHWS